MFNMNRIAGLWILTVFLLSGTAANAGPDKRGAVLVVPNRYTIVQIGFAMARLRPVALVTYEELERSGKLVMFSWEPGLRDWIKTDPSELAARVETGKLPGKVIFVGDVPDKLAEISKSLSNTQEIPSLDVVSLINALNLEFKFKTHEWRWLAAQFGLKIKDLNEERRRYGRYGKPGRLEPRPVPPSGKQESSEDSKGTRVMPAETGNADQEKDRSEKGVFGVEVDAVPGLEDRKEKPQPATRDSEKEDILPEDK